MAEQPADAAAPGAYQLLQLGACWGVLVGLGVAAGYALDRALGSGPLLVFVGLAVGIFSAAAGSYFLLRPYLQDVPPGTPPSKDAS
jgi:F0F1-type ATP synthase assembly protein I